MSTICTCRFIKFVFHESWRIFHLQRTQWATAPARLAHSCFWFLVIGFKSSSKLEEWTASYQGLVWIGFKNNLLVSNWNSSAFINYLAKWKRKWHLQPLLVTTTDYRTKWLHSCLGPFWNMIYVDNHSTDLVLRYKNRTHLLNKQTCVSLVSITSMSDFWPVCVW